MNLFKYTSIQTAMLILESGTIRWSSPVIFNDLEECQFTPFTKEQHLLAQEWYMNVMLECAKGRLIFDHNRFSPATSQIISVIKMGLENSKLSTAGLAEIAAAIAQDPERDFKDHMNIALIRCMRVLCLTTKYNNHLMWAHYADQNCGCVIEFEEIFFKPPRNLRQGFIRYHENLTPLSNPLDALLYEETTEIKNLMFQDVVFSKRSIWSYEEEYRFMYSESFGEITTKVDLMSGEKKIEVRGQSEKLHTDMDISLQSIKSITFGVRADKRKIDKLIKSIVDKNMECEIYQMEQNNGVLIRKAISLNLLTPIDQT